MIMTNTDYVPGRDVGEILGLVRGNTIQAKVFYKDIKAQSFSVRWGIAWFILFGNKKDVD